MYVLEVNVSFAGAIKHGDTDITQVVQFMGDVVLANRTAMQ
jgi:hypothetical protein